MKIYIVNKIDLEVSNAIQLALTISSSNLEASYTNMYVR